MNKYCIVDKSVTDGLTQSQIDQCAPKTLDFRPNIAGDKTIVEYVSGSKPSFLKGVTSYDHAGICAIVWDPANGWQGAFDGNA